MTEPQKSSAPAASPRPTPTSVATAAGPRSLEQLAAQLGALRETNAALAREVEQLRAKVADGTEQQVALEQRVFRAEQGLAKLERRVAEERRQLVEQQDQFIAGLVAEHEREMGALRAEIGVRNAEEKVATDDPAIAHLRGALDLDSAFDRPTLPAPMPEITAAALDRAAQRASELDWASLQQRARASSMPAHGSPSNAPLKTKPQASTRPLVDYALGTDEVQAEHLEGARLSRPPKP